MRTLLSILTILCVACGLLALAADVKPPEKLVFETKMGNVTYQHAKHLERAKGDCKVCHDALFQQSAKAPLNYKAGMHKPAEADKRPAAIAMWPEERPSPARAVAPSAT